MSNQCINCRNWLGDRNRDRRFNRMPLKKGFCELNKMPTYNTNYCDRCEKVIKL